MGRATSREYAPRTLAPGRNWRVSPLAIYDSGNNTTWKNFQLAGGGSGSGSWFSVADGATRTVALKVPAGGPYIWSWVESDPTDFSATLSFSSDSTNGVDGTWTDPTAVDLWHVPTAQWSNAANGQKVDIPASDAPRWFKVAFTAGATAGDGVVFKCFRLHRLTPGVRMDYWLIIGASIDERACDPALLYDAVVAQYPDRDPLIFNRAQESLNAAQILALVPGVIEQHPNASYAIIHSCGNNVSATRTVTGPTAGNLATAINDSNSICALFQANGTLPILGRLSWRDYNTGAKVFGGRNPIAGSWPFMAGIDGLRAIYNQGVPFDLYTFTRNRPAVISTDGVHWDGSNGNARYREMLVQQVFSYVYTGTALFNEEMKKHAIVNCAASTAVRNTYTGNELFVTVNSSVAIKTVEGAETGWTCTVTAAPETHGPNLGKVTGDNSGAYIDDILRDYHYVGNTVQTGTYTISGLTPGRHYTIKLMGGRDVVAANRVSSYTVTGGIVSGSVWQWTATLDAAGNTSTTADFTFVPANSGGVITIGLARHTGSTYGYLSCIEIIEH